MYLFLLFIYIIIFMEKVLLVIVIIMFIIFIISIIYCYIKIDITVFNIVNKKIDKNLKLMFLSDLHNRNIYKKLKIILEQEKPDIIICGGDMVNEGLNGINNYMSIIPLLKEYKTYYTFGNHEEIINENNYLEYKEYIKYLNKTSIILLNNKSFNLSKNIRLIGLNPNLEYYRRFRKEGLNKEIITNYTGKINKKHFNILVSHNPLEFNSYVDYGVDIILCGHVHGGVVKLPLFGALLSPDFTLFPKHYEGMYKKNYTSMIVSRGIGFSTKLPFRIFNHPEIVIINLKNK